MKIKQFQRCLFALLIGFIFLTISCSKEESQIAPEVSINLVDYFEIKDSHFENALKKLGIGVKDHFVLKGEVKNINYLDLKELGITDLSGIEYFVSLKELLCNNNALTSLDVSKNKKLNYLSCYKNRLTKLDVSNNINLDVLYCDVNRLTGLDISKNIVLRILGCVDNELTSLDISNNPKLHQLWFSNNQLTSIDVKNNMALMELGCNDNELTSLDISQNTALIELQCATNQLDSLDIGHTVLRKLGCYNNPLTCIQVNQTQLSSIPSGWRKDAGAAYSLNCN